MKSSRVFFLSFACALIGCGGDDTTGSGSTGATGTGTGSSTGGQTTGSTGTSSSTSGSGSGTTSTTGDTGTGDTGTGGGDTGTGGATTGGATTGGATTGGATTGGAAECGNGVVEMGEVCDDGNKDNGDFCLQNCQPASCTDGYANADETDLDCGGPTCGATCLNGKMCGAAADCVSGVCSMGGCTCTSWEVQAGSTGQDRGNAVAVDPEGRIYLAGNAGAALPDATSFGSTDAFVQRYDGASGLALTPSGDLVIAGYTRGAIANTPPIGESDIFVRTLTSAGAEVWTTQFGTSAVESAFAATVAPDGSVYAAGFTRGTLPGETYAGGDDAFVAKLATDGTLLWARQLGSVGADAANAIAVAPAGGVIVAGAAGGDMGGQTALGNGDAFVARLDEDGSTVWLRLVGSSENDRANGVAVTAAGAIYLAGSTSGALPGETALGLGDGFLARLDENGVLEWGRNVGTMWNDVLRAVALRPGGGVVASGDTAGLLPMETSAGGRDVFVVAYDAAGTQTAAQQLGSSSDDEARGVAVDAAGDVLVSGNTQGDLGGPHAGGVTDAFLARLCL